MAETGVQSIAHDEANRRDFLKILTVAAGGLGVAALAWPFIDALNPDRAAQGVAYKIVDVGGIAENTAISVFWSGLPIFIRKLTAKQINDNQFVVTDTLSDPRGPYDGWLCPCDGSVYDPLGRIRGGPAKANLAIPRFTFLNATQLQFG